MVDVNFETGETNFLLGKHNRGLGKYDQISSSIGRVTTLLSLRDQHIQVKDLVDVNGWSLSEALQRRKTKGNKIGGSLHRLNKHGDLRQHKCVVNRRPVKSSLRKKRKTNGRKNG